jgi:hypothetical protein
MVDIEVVEEESQEKVGVMEDPKDEILQRF